jgi:cytochrome c
MTGSPLRTATLFLALVVTGGAAKAGNAVEGGRIAERWCSSCHVAGNHSAGRSAGTDAVPTLESIAKDPRRSPDWLRQWLSDPHPPMPNPHLTRTEIEDVVSYLQSLN